MVHQHEVGIIECARRLAVMRKHQPLVDVDMPNGGRSSMILFVFGTQVANSFREKVFLTALILGTQVIPHNAFSFGKLAICISSKLHMFLIMTDLSSRPCYQ